MPEIKKSILVFLLSLVMGFMLVYGSGSSMAFAAGNM
jgi:hypothetical protein